MKKILLIIYLVQISMLSYSQKININFIISIDNNVNPTISNLIIKAIKNNTDTIVFNLDYSPGNLIMKKKDYKELLNKETEIISFELTYSEICKDNIEFYNYKIESFEKKWLKGYYFILYMYNTNKRKYKKIFNPIPTKEFTYEYDSPNGSLRRVTKRKRKKCLK